MTFKKKMGRKSRYARNKEKDNTKTIINDSMYVIGVDPYSIEEENQCGISIAKITGNGDGTITTEYFSKSGKVLPVIKEEHISVFKRIKNFINKLLK